MQHAGRGPVLSDPERTRQCDGDVRGIEQGHTLREDQFGANNPGEPRVMAEGYHTRRNADTRPLKPFSRVSSTRLVELILTNKNIYTRRQKDLPKLLRMSGGLLRSLHLLIQNGQMFSSARIMISQHSAGHFMS